MTKPVHSKRFRFLGQRFIVLILASLVFGAAGYVAAEWLPPTPKSVVLGIASALVALGVVTFASEFILKGAFTEDVLDISNLKHEVYNAGILQVTDESEMNWQELISDTREVRVVALRPARFQQSMWRHILRLATDRDLTVRITLVDPKSSAVKQVAERLGETTEYYADEINRTAKAIENEWNRAKSTSAWRSRKSELHIDTISAASTHSIIRVDGKTCLIAEPVLADAGSQTTMVITFRDMAGMSFAQRWLADGLQDVAKYSEAPLYSDDGRGVRS